MASLQLRDTLTAQGNSDSRIPASLASSIIWFLGDGWETSGVKACSLKAVISSDMWVSKLQTHPQSLLHMRQDQDTVFGVVPRVAF